MLINVRKTSHILSVLLGLIVFSTMWAARPNIVFIITDDQRWDALSVVQEEMGERARFPWLKTPFLDQLAREGVRFRESFVVNSVCSPARAGLLSGQYNHFNGVANNVTPFPIDAVTVPSLLRESGYTTGMFGKWHMGGQSGHRPGFDVSKSYVGHGRYFDCPYEINGKRIETQGWVDDVTTNFAIDFMRENRNRPFLAWIGLKSPHDDRKPATRHANDYKDDSPRSVPNLNRFPPPHMNALQAAKGAERNPVYLMDYFRTLNGVDECVGRVMEALEQLGLQENTVIIFTSDNGYYLGEHSSTDKRMAHEESLRVPLLIRYPSIVSPGRVSDQMVINLDLSATMLELAGVTVPEDWQGQSLAPLLANVEPVADWRDAYFYQYFYEKKGWPPTVTAVRTEHHKLIKYHFQNRTVFELFDLEADPYETRNLYHEPAYQDLRESMLARYRFEKEAVGFFVPDYAHKLGRIWPDKL